MLLIFGSAKLMAEILERFHQPGLIGEILAGILLGSGVLGWVAPNDVLIALANLGAIFLLFEIGLEVRSSELLKVGGTALVVATLGVIVPFAAGWGIVVLWGAGNIAALFVGAAMVATSVGITARVLASRGWLEERASKILLAAAVIDDVLGLIVLAVVSSAARDRFEWLSLSFTAVLALGFTFIVAQWGTRSMAKLIPGVRDNFRVGEAQFAFSMILLFALAFAAAVIGVAAIVGAFLAGLALAENVSARVKHLAHGVTELLVPFFLVGIGLSVNLRAFTQSRSILLAVTLTLAAVASKLIGCGLGALRLGKVDALRIGVGMIPRGEVGMVVAQLGLTMGVIEHSLYSVVVFMAVATTMLPLPFLKLLYSGAGRRPAATPVE